MGIDRGFLRHGGTPIAGGFIRENPVINWMIWGYPSFRKPPDRPLKVPAVQGTPATKSPRRLVSIQWWAH